MPHLSCKKPNKTKTNKQKNPGISVHVQWRNDRVSYPYKWFTSYGCLKEDCCGFKKRIRMPLTPAILNSSSNCTMRPLSGWQTEGLLAWRFKSNSHVGLREVKSERKNKRGSHSAVVTTHLGQPAWSQIHSSGPSLLHAFQTWNTHRCKNLWWPTQTSCANIVTQVTQKTETYSKQHSHIPYLRSTQSHTVAK